MKPHRPLVLCVLDGVGERAELEGNAVRRARMPALERLRAQHPNTSLDVASDLVAARIPSGAVGHACLGLGRPWRCEADRLDEDLAARRLTRNPAVEQIVRWAMAENCRVHFVGLLSESTLHSSLTHLRTLIDYVQFQNIDIAVHAILDGRDGGRRAGVRILEQLEHVFDDHVKLATVSGRAYAMDTGARWERTYSAFHAIVRDAVLGPEAAKADNAYDTLYNAYGRGLDDDTIVPTRIGDYAGVRGSFACDFSGSRADWAWYGEEAGIAFNHRSDGLQQLVAMFHRAVPDDIAVDLLCDREKPVYAFRTGCFATLADHGLGELEVPVAYRSVAPDDGFGALCARAGLRQLRCAGAEKEAHVTHFFDGGRRAPLAGEVRRILAADADLMRHAEAPALESEKVARAVEQALAAHDVDFVLVNLGNADLVAHGGAPEAVDHALEALDTALDRIARAVEAAGGVLVVTADHGHVESLVDTKTAGVHAHSSARVPLIVAGGPAGMRLQPNGRLSDVAPTMLELLGLEKPPAMTGASLIVR